MVGLMLSQMEAKEFEYLLKKEMEELLYDLQDHQIDKMVRSLIEERYHVLFRLFSRLATPAECLRFCRRNKSQS